MKRYIGIAFLLSGLLLLSGCGKEKNISLSDSNGTKDTKSIQEYDINNLVLSQDADYDETYINEIGKTVYTVNDKVSQENISYVFITDTHIGKEDSQTDVLYRQLNAAVDVANNSEVDFLCLGGDIEDGRFDEAKGGKQTALDILQNVSNILKRCEKPVFILKGNHDDNSFSAQEDGNLLFDPDYIIDSSEWYNVTMKNFSQYASDYQDGYYYYDIPEKNTRVVCLNMSNSSDEIVDGQRVEMGMYYYGYKDEQIEWLLNKAMSRTDCKYVFLCHDGFDYIEGYGENSNRDVLASILSAAYNHNNFSSEKFSKDFSNWTGKIQIFTNGHMHMDKMLNQDVVGGMPALSLEAAAIYPYNAKAISSLPSPWNTYSRTEGRKLGSVDEAAFNVVVCNGSNKGDVLVIKFGKGEDKEY